MEVPRVGNRPFSTGILVAQAEIKESNEYREKYPLEEEIPWLQRQLEYEMGEKYTVSEVSPNILRFENVVYADPDLQFDISKTQWYLLRPCTGCTDRVPVPISRPQIGIAGWGQLVPSRKVIGHGVFQEFFCPRCEQPLATYPEWPKFRQKRGE